MIMHPPVIGPHPGCRDGNGAAESAGGPGQSRHHRGESETHEGNGKETIEKGTPKKETHTKKVKQTEKTGECHTRGRDVVPDIFWTIGIEGYRKCRLKGVVN